MVWGLGALAALGRTLVQFAAPTWQFTTICDCSSAVFLCTQAPDMHVFGEDTYMSANTHTHLKIKIKNKHSRFSHPTWPHIPQFQPLPQFVEFTETLGKHLHHSISPGCATSLLLLPHLERLFCPMLQLYIQYGTDRTSYKSFQGSGYQTFFASHFSQLETF